MQDAWPALREGWLRIDAERRHRIVTVLAAAGEGEAAALGTPDGDLAFLATLRDARMLHRAVLGELWDLGCRDGETDVASERSDEPDWQRFGRALSETIGVLEPGQYLRVGAGDLRLEFRRDETGLGLVAGDGAEQAVPSRGDEDPADLVATALELIRARDVGRPGELTYVAGTDDGQAVLLPLLGIPRAGDSALPLPVPPQGPDSEGLRAGVEDTIAKAFDLDEVRYDVDGDIPLRYGSAMVFVRVVEDSPIVRVFAPMLWEVPESSELLRAINAINLQVAFARVAWDGKYVSVRTEFVALPFEPKQLIVACQTVGEIADHFDDRLQGRFGGRIFFGKVVPAKDSGYEYGGYL